MIDHTISINKDVCEQLAAYIIAIGGNAIRKKVALELKRDFPQAQFPTMVHKSGALALNLY